MSYAKAKRLLGVGHAFTGFLIAPVAASEEKREKICSLGAVLNLMVSVCDELLDDGSTPESVLPDYLLAGARGDGSIVAKLLRLYQDRLSELEVRYEIGKAIEKRILQMFDAEVRTVRIGRLLSYRDWLRKSALPFVVMGLPICSSGEVMPGADILRHVRWLFKAGRFCGAVDDTSDLMEDSATGHPNCWYNWKEQTVRFYTNRIAAWGSQVLSEWDQMADGAAESLFLREIFLHSIWQWLRQPAVTHASVEA